MLNLAEMLEHSARAVPDRDAVVLGETRLTYAQVDGAANQVANLLVSRGIGPGDKVALSCPNLPYFPIVYYGILKAGAAVVPLNVLFKGREVAYHLGTPTRRRTSASRARRPADGRGGWDGFRRPTAAHFFLINRRPAAPGRSRVPRVLGAAVRGPAADVRDWSTEPTDTAVILYTSRDHRPAQGRGARTPTWR